MAQGSTVAMMRKALSKKHLQGTKSEKMHKSKGFRHGKKC